MVSQRRKRNQPEQKNVYKNIKTKIKIMHNHIKVHRQKLEWSQRFFLSSTFREAPNKSCKKRPERKTSGYLGLDSQGAFHFAKGSGNFGRNSNGTVHFGFF